MAEIELKNITKEFGEVTAVNSMNLSVASHDFTTLLGPSGCGKSTTLRMISGLEKPTKGEIYIKGKCVYSKEKNIYIPPGKRNLGMVFQSYALWPHLTVFDNISFGLEINKRKNLEAKTKEVAEILEIADLLERYPNELSGGQQQRVAIARVLVMDYDILLLDEPLSNLDAKLRMDMRAELKRLHNKLNSTIIYVTHDQLEALTMSSNIAVMEKGNLMQYAPPMEIYNKPANLFTAKFIGNPPINLFSGKLKLKDIKTGEAVLKKMRIAVKLDQSKNKYTDGQEIIIGVRPENIELLLSDKDFAEHTIKGTIYSVLPAGSEWYFKIKLDNEKVITATAYDGMGLKQDDTVYVKINKEDVKLFDSEGNAYI